MSSSQPTPILFCYDISIFSRKMDHYLGLRGIVYNQCIQPPNMPRPDLEALGINYRKIPILAIGKDIYIDTHLIIPKLESLYPDNVLGSSKPFEQGLEKIFESWVTDAGPFWKTAGCMPLSSPALNDEVWMKDRAELVGPQFTLENLRAGRSDCLAHWVFDTEKPTLGDLHLGFCFDWALHIQMGDGTETVDNNVLNEHKYPKVFAWVERFREAYSESIKMMGSPQIVSSEVAIRNILTAEFTEAEGAFLADDPLHLEKDQIVEVGPAAFGGGRVDRGRLISLSVHGVVIEKAAPTGELLRLHFPRAGYQITMVEGA
ncbi:hypothetical protein FKW77_001204 [Venturia effusa]|uniref:Uncharacterized protein n=1 Tax=Venturia effusa TaxID=50376 RepID=A0A517LQK7_9PEZI|nr:hypothetical protein FKW77_001204 [Venturia effusa]